MIPASVMAKMATLGLSAEQADAVARMLSAVEAATKEDAGGAIAARRASDRDRKARQRHGKSRDVTGQDVTDRDTPTPSPKRKVSPCTPSKENNPIPTPEQTLTGLSAPAKRASRVDGFEPDVGAAVEMGLSPDRARLQVAKFLDFWRGKPGKDGTKADWPATWRNWIRSEIERNGTGEPAHRSHSPPASRSRPMSQAERLRLKLLGEYDENLQQPDDPRTVDADFRRTGAH